MAEHLWEKLPDETLPAYQAFCVYRDLGPDRSGVQAFRILKGRPEAKHIPGVWCNWCVQFRWRERAAAYDLYLEARARAKAEKQLIDQRAEMLARHGRLGKAMVMRALEYLAEHKFEKGQDAIIAARTGSELERQSLGLPAWILEVLSADEAELRERFADLDARRRAALALHPESAGDLLAIGPGAETEAEGDPYILVPDPATDHGPGDLNGA